MSQHRVAVRYAKAILDLAQEKGVLNEVYNDMEFFEKTCDDNPELAAVLQNPIIASFKKLAILKQLLTGKVNPLTISFFEIIAKKNREEVLYVTAKEFETQYEAFKNIARAQITTTIPLTDDLRTQITEVVAKATNKTIRLYEKVDTNLIGGFVLTINNNQLDGSVKSQLNKIKKELF